MQQLEIIHLRSSGEPPEALAERIRSSLRSAGDREVMTLYRRHGVETDLAIHLRRSAKAGVTRPSQLALQLAAELRQYGLVEHSLWQELR